ncbi:MAG: MMPL family transporter [Cyclobacteriaceae bacterium]
MIFVWLALTTFFGFHAKDLKPDFEFEKLFPTNDPDIVFYEQHLKKFGYDNDFMLVVLEADPLFDQQFLAKVNGLCESIRSIRGTESLVSPLEIQQAVSGPLGWMNIPILHASQEEKYQSDSIKIFSHPFYSSFFGEDKKSLILQIVHRHFTSPEEASAYQMDLKNALGVNSVDDNRLVGKISAQEEFVHFIQKDFGVFIAAALIISLLVLIVIFRSFRSAIVPYLIAISSLVWVLGMMALTGNSITILSSLIPPIILFVSTSDAIHLLNNYKRTKNEVSSKRMAVAISKVFVPTLLTSVTTAIGFFSLIFIETEPVQALGVFTGAGVAIAFIITFLISPVLIYGWKTSSSGETSFKRYAIWVLKNQRLVFVLSFVFITISIYGLYRIQTDATLLGDLPQSSDVRQDFEYVENQYFGYKPYEIAYWPKSSESSIWDEDVMGEALKIQKYLENEFAVGRIWSPINAMKYGNQTINGGIGSYYQFPDPKSYDRARKALKPMIRQDSSIGGTLSKDQKYARIKGFIPELGSKETIEKNDLLLSYLEKNIDKSVIDYRITGTTYLIDKSHESLSLNLIKGLLIAILLVSLVLGVYFKSLRLLLISLVPNLIPLLITAGFMGLVGIPLKLTTSIIFAVSFGIAVDDTIHFISAYIKAPYINRIYSMIYAFRSAGSSIIITSVIILAGFGIFLFSSFGATYFLGLFICLALTSAAIIDLTLLPLLLNLLNQKRNS